MSIIDRARELRAVIEKTAQTLDDTEALQAVELFPQWKAGTAYKTDDRVQHAGVLYKCLQDHTSQADWTPNNAVSLFAKVLIPDPEIIPEWEQPDSTNPYTKGDKVKYKEHTYESLIDGNIWAPDAYPAGWKQI